MKALTDSSFVSVQRRANLGSVLHRAVAAARRIGDALAAAREERRRARRLRRQIRLLAELDTRTLKDIGLHRAEIGSLAAELAGDSAASRCHASDGPDRPAGSVSPLY